MNDFKLTNLRELSTKEQNKINGGFSPLNCSSDCGECSCICKCDSRSTTNSISNSSSATGAKSKSGRKQRESMIA